MPLTEAEELELLELEEIEAPSGDFFMKPVSDLAGSAIHGLTSGFSDELLGLISPELGEAHRQNVQATAEKYPVASTIAEIGGAIATGAGAIKAFPKAAEGIAKYAARGLPQAAAATGGVAAASGGLYSAGVAEEDKLAAGVEGALFAAPLGIAGVAGARALPAIGRGFGSLKDRAIKAMGTPEQMAAVTTREVAEQAAMPTASMAMTSPAGVAKVEQAIKRDFPDNWEQVLDAWKSEGETALIDLYGTKSRQLAKGAAQYAGGQEVAEEFFSKRVLLAPEKLKESIAKNISGDDAYFATVDDILEIGRSEAKPLYKKVESAIIQPTEKNLAVLTSDEVATAFARAKKEYPSKLQGLQEDSVMAMDYTKRVLDDDIGKAIRSGEGNKASYLKGIKNELLDVMDEASPEYKMARKRSGDYLSLTSAMDAGKNFMKQDPELIAKSFKALPDMEKTAYRSGVSKQMRDIIDKTIDGSNPYNRIIGRPEQQKRLRAILSPVQYKGLLSDAKAQDRLFKLRNDVLGGSPTTSKAVAAAEIAGAGADIASMTSGGMPVRDASSAMLRRMFDGLNDKTSKQVADILFEQRPTEKLKMYSAMVGSKNLTNTERQALKKAYHKADELFKADEIKGAVGAGVFANQGEIE